MADGRGIDHGADHIRKVLPPVKEGRYVDRNEYGCHTCGWSVPLEGRMSEGDRRAWVTHTHDPMCDLTERVLSGEMMVPTDDVVYLLGLLDPENWG